MDTTSGGEKLIKDPIYGYICLTDDAVKIINTDVFQRLRNIRQTSYAPLYPSSLHNRFVHSLGVYHLGRIAADALFKRIGDQLVKSEQKHIHETFLTACLLHDVGHAPFSHIGEVFFNQPDSEGTIRTRATISSAVKPFLQRDVIFRFTVLVIKYIYVFLRMRTSCISLRTTSLMTF
ncbi:MAG: HD domain-containing protein [Clostridiales bacterium]|nr:HD domain-containing protein [Clostridiales bacterium]